MAVDRFAWRSTGPPTEPRGRLNDHPFVGAQFGLPADLVAIAIGVGAE